MYTFGVIVLEREEGAIVVESTAILAIVIKGEMLSVFFSSIPRLASDTHLPLNFFKLLCSRNLSPLMVYSFRGGGLIWWTAHIFGPHPNYGRYRIWLHVYNLKCIIYILYF